MQMGKTDLENLLRSNVDYLGKELGKNLLLDHCLTTPTYRVVEFDGVDVTGVSTFLRPLELLKWIREQACPPPAEEEAAKRYAKWAKVMEQEDKRLVGV